MQLLKKQKSVSTFFSSFLKSRLNFNIVQTKMNLIADVFVRLCTKKNVVR